MYILIFIYFENQAASTPESANTHKRNQLRELAQLNGTLRDDENQACQNCGTLGHRKYDCPQQANFTANILCRTCGSKGHMAKDCKVNGGRGGPDSSNGDNASPGGGGAPQSAQFDTEYASLMAELGEAPRGGGESGSVSGHGTSTPLNSTSVSTSSRSVPPWRDPANWLVIRFICIKTHLYIYHFQIGKEYNSNDHSNTNVTKGNSNMADSNNTLVSRSKTLDRDIHTIPNRIPMRILNTNNINNPKLLRSENMIESTPLIVNI